MFSPWFQVSHANYMDVVNWVHAISTIFTKAYLLQGAHYTYLAHSTLLVWFIDIYDVCACVCVCVCDVISMRVQKEHSRLLLTGPQLLYALQTPMQTDFM